MTNQELVKNLKNKGVLKSPHIIEAFKNIDRKDFVLEKYQNSAYLDLPLPIGFQQTISQPYTVAFMLELLSPEKDNKILDIGSGSAYTSALLANIVKNSGRVDAFEIIEQLIKQAKENIKKYKDLKINFYLADKKKLGNPSEKYDRILVSAAASKIPEELISQLNVNGRLVIPINSSICQLKKKDNNIIEKFAYYGFSFVPLINN
jgi:protein-L-isoaspartate(D-aspartate) O-methyltransferase